MRAKQGKLRLKLVLVQSVTKAPAIRKQRDRNILMVEGLSGGIEINVDHGDGELQFGAHQFQNPGRLFAKVAAAARVEEDVYHRISRRK